MSRSNRKEKLHTPETPPGVQPPPPKPPLVRPEYLFYAGVVVAVIGVVLGGYWVQQHYTLIPRNGAGPDSADTEDDGSVLSSEERQQTLESLTPPVENVSIFTPSEEEDARRTLSSDSPTGSDGQGDLSDEEYQNALESLQAP